MFWWFMFFSDLFVPVIMILCGRMMWKNPPKNINSMIGYRTARSMKNIDTWKFAHEHSGKLWWKIGWILFILSALVHIPIYGATDEVIGKVGGILVSVQVVLLIGSIFPTERALKNTFTDDGIRKK